MKIGRLIDLTNDASDLLDFFEGVETQEQLVSRLERLKRGATEELLACIEGLRASNQSFRDDTVEPSGTLGDEDEPEEDLGDLLSELESADAQASASADEDLDTTTFPAPTPPTGSPTPAPVPEPEASE
jgi:hypothetical protein